MRFTMGDSFTDAEKSYQRSKTGSDANKKQVAGTHYKKQVIQHWDYVVANGIPYLEAQVIKYVSRHQDKNGIQDLEKAKHFLEKLIEVEKEKKNVDNQVP